MAGPDGGFAGGFGGSGRVDLRTEVDTQGRSADRRSDFDEVYGDWSALRTMVGEARGVVDGSGAPLAAELKSALFQAEADPRGLSDAQAHALVTADGPGLAEVCRLADHLRREAVGDDVTYVVNRNINSTNVCYVGCRFCAFAQRRTDADA